MHGAVNAPTHVVLRPGTARRPRLSVVIPTLNEVANVAHLVRRITRALRDVDHEILLVDDASTDGTADLAESIRPRFPQLRVLRRTEDFGLSKSILAGFAAARGELLAVMDADLQHDPAVLPTLVAAAGSNDIVVASRYAFRARTCGWSLFREAESRLAAWWTRRTLQVSAHDPLSGFFVLHRHVFDAVRSRLKGGGWKLLLEILVHSRGATVAEVPFIFTARRRGQTKMSGRVVRDWLRSLRELRRFVGATPSHDVLVGAHA